MPLPPGTTSFPPTQSIGTAERRWFYVDAYVKGSTGARSRRGPYPCEYLQTNGTIEIANKGGDLVTVDARVYFPIVSGVKPRAVIVDLANNVTYEVLNTQRWSTRIEAFVRRTMPD